MRDENHEELDHVASAGRGSGGVTILIGKMVFLEAEWGNFKQKIIGKPVRSLTRIYVINNKEWVAKRKTE